MPEKNHSHLKMRPSYRFLKNASGLLLIVLTAVFISACDQGLSENEKEEIAANHAAAKETLAMLEESRKLSEEARKSAEDTKRLVDEAQEQAKKMAAESEMKKKTSDVQNAVQATVLALVAHNTEEAINPPLSSDSYVVDDIDGLLFKYGWRRNPDLMYEIQYETDNEYGGLYFVVTVRHQDPTVPAFRYDPNSGRGIEPVE